MIQRSRRDSDTIIFLLRSKVGFRKGYVIDSTDRRYDDAERIMRTVDQRLAIGHSAPHLQCRY